MFPLNYGKKCLNGIFRSGYNLQEMAVVFQDLRFNTLNDKIFLVPEQLLDGTLGYSQVS